MLMLIGDIFGFIVFLLCIWFYWPILKHEFKQLRKVYKDNEKN